MKVNGKSMIKHCSFILTFHLLFHREHRHLHRQSGRRAHPQREVDEGEVEADHARRPDLHRAEGPGVQTGDPRGDQVGLGSVQVCRLQQARGDRVQLRLACGGKERVGAARGRPPSQTEEVSVSQLGFCRLTGSNLTAESDLNHF